MSATSASASHGDAHAHAGGHHTSLGLDNRKIAIWAFIGSECMLFASLISTYLIYKGRSPQGPFPHEPWTNPATGEVMKPILDIPVTSASTFVLLMSSVAMVMALNAVQTKHEPKVSTWDKIKGSSKLWLWMTAGLGTVFLGFQAYEFTSFINEGLTIRTNLFGSSFFTLTGFHGVHVSVGIIMLLATVAMVRRNRIPGQKAEVVEMVGLYWHFVDIVWIIIFTLVYLIPS
jgi:cytochrome c oxidase subunit 3/cytochrome o ubiquinol oxidase subunit 3